MRLARTLIGSISPEHSEDDGTTQTAKLTSSLPRTAALARHGRGPASKEGWCRGSPRVRRTRVKWKMEKRLLTTRGSSYIVKTMNMVFNERQIDTLSEFLANMAVAWFIAGFVSQQSAQSLVVYTSYGVLSLYTALFLKGGS